ncbi:alkaline phosphatase family protein [Brevundimonas sp. VNH65]|uniref:alkaline phosphatase family protein n=1 Tax=Brevundimonas sp. VNH65 TaxID=3400917 RepID=UPI003C0FD42A
MKPARAVARCLLLAAALAVSAPAAAQAPEAPPAEASSDRADGPALIVTVVIDQFSANLFNQYRSRFTGGLKRLADEGLVSINGYQTHGLTETCPGHSTILTGRHPTGTGIPANDWIDPATGQEVYCLAAPENTLAHGRITDNGPVGPGQLKATTVADWLKDVSPQSRVFAVSGKDRGAINLNGHNGNGAYWFTGSFGLTTYVEPGQTAEERLAPVAGFNALFQAAARLVEGDDTSEAPVMWTGAYAQCQALAGDWTIRGQTFRSAVPPASQEFDTSPLLDEVTLAAAEYLLNSQQLGRRGVTDMLGVSLSGTDRIGHSFGTQGPEMCEQMYRLDAAMGAFLDRLDDVPGGVLLVLTADHGGSDFVEREAVHGYPHAHRLDTAAIGQVNAALRAEFSLDADPLQSGSSGLLVADGERKALPEPLRTRVATAAVERLRPLPDVGFVERREVLAAEPLPASTANPEMLTLRERMRLSTLPDGRSADLIFTLAPNVSAGGRVGGTLAGHGSPWEYDRRVPIIFWKPGGIDGEGRGQERFLPIRTIDIAPTLANVIGLKTANDLDGRCIDLGLFPVPTCPIGP